MTESPLTSKNFLLQLDIAKEVLPKVGKQQWPTLHLLRADIRPHWFEMWYALLDEEAAAKAINPRQLGPYNR